MSESAADKKPILCIDFDGVIHSYERGWQDGTIYGELTPGFAEWAERARKLFRLIVYSSRSKDPGGIDKMARWLAARMPDNWQCTDLPTEHMPVLRLLDAHRAELLMFHFASQKPAAFLTIDDRAVQFRGDWSTPRMAPDTLRAFVPWNVKP